MTAVTRLGDLVGEAWAALGCRPLRLALSAAATVVGVASLTVTLGLAMSARAAILGSFDRDDATTVVATWTPSTGPADSDAAVIDRVAHLRGVHAVATLRTVSGQVEAASAPGDTGAGGGLPVDVVAAKGSVAEAAGARVRSGRTFDAGLLARGWGVALLGRNAARTAGIDHADGTTAVLVAGRPVVVLGVLDGARRWPALDDSVVVPETWASRYLHADASTTLIATTSLGAGAAVGGELPVATAPIAPGAVDVHAPPDLTTRRADIGRELGSLALSIGCIGLIAGGLAIANASVVAVLERRDEIAVRRALGSTRAAVGGQFLVEAATIGLIGGVVGSASSLLTLVVICSLRGWPVVLPLSALIAGPVLGVAVGLVAGAAPAVRGASVSPAVVLRSAR